MPRWIRTIMVILPLAMIMVLAAAACEEESPPASNPAPGSASGARISVDPDTVDFGQVPLDKEVRYVFNVKNVGTDTLTLRGVQIRVVEGC
ncbi:MAG: hypothetical protein Q8P59_07490 [Dehalococcoidia bacterium]|nr:hypothetical protein [Dehalococcoidia bacterium]